MRTIPRLPKTAVPRAEAKPAQKGAPKDKGVDMKDEKREASRENREVCSIVGLLSCTHISSLTVDLSPVFIKFQPSEKAPIAIIAKIVGIIRLKATAGTIPSHFTGTPTIYNP